jgi:hypothetical protein
MCCKEPHPFPLPLSQFFRALYIISASLIAALIYHPLSGNRKYYDQNPVTYGGSPLNHNRN